MMPVSSSGYVPGAVSSAARVEVLARSHRRALLTCARKELRDIDPDGVEGVVQSAFLLLLEKPGILPDDPADDIRTAMVTVRNLARNRRRKAKAREAGSLTEAIRPAGWYGRTMTKAERAILRRAVMEAMSNLSEQERRVVELRFWHGMTYDGVAKTLGCSLRTAKARWKGAKGRLAGLLGGLE